jgi:outer membrane lipopolysaccharide assembly protein LptE/RlpB
MLFLKRKYTWAVIFLWLFFSACGYRFTGGGNFPFGIRSINVKILENRTAETGLENIFTNDLIYEFVRHKKVVLTSSDKADAILSGVIKSLRIRTIASKGQLTASARRAEVAVDLQLTDPDGRVKWSANDVSLNETYNVAPSKQATEQNKRDAITALSKKHAEKIYYRLTDDF